MLKGHSLSEQHRLSPRPASLLLSSLGCVLPPAPLSNLDWNFLKMFTVTSGKMRECTQRQGKPLPTDTCSAP